jgi:DNA-binding CsgD family transcriptional regulator
VDYPTKFPNRLELRLAAAVLKAQRRFPAEHQAKERIMAGILAFAEIACVAVESGEWRGELALHGLDEFLHTLCVDPARARCFDSGAFDRFAGPIKREIRESEEWLAVVERLAAAAEHVSRPQPPVEKHGGQSPKSPVLPSNATARTGKTRSEREWFDGLGKKLEDQANYYATAGLTTKQQAAYSLRREYGRSIAEVARRMGIDRKTVYDHVLAADRKINANWKNRRSQSGSVKKSQPSD